MGNIYKGKFQNKFAGKNYETEEQSPTGVVKTTFLKIFNTRLDKTRKGFHMEWSCHWPLKWEDWRWSRRSFPFLTFLILWSFMGYSLLPIYLLPMMPTFSFYKREINCILHFKLISYSQWISNIILSTSLGGKVQFL